MRVEFSKLRGDKISDSNFEQQKRLGRVASVPNV